MPFNNISGDDITNSMWLFTGGAILVLLQSILSNAKRNWWSLLIGCGLGGAGAWIAGNIWAESDYIYIICGVAAVITENLLGGIVNASRQFAENPIKVATHVSRTILPAFGKNAGETSASIETGDLK